MAFRYSNFPDSIDDLKRLPEYQELSDEDKTYIGRYTELCQRGSSMTPQEKLEFNDLLNNKLKDKMIQSVDWNLLADAVTNCQDFFLNHVLKDISDMVNEKEQEFKNMTEEAKHEFTELVDNKDKKFTQMVDEKTNEFNTRVDSFIDKGIYNNDTHYNKHNFVHYDDGTGVNVYIALKDTQRVSPSDDGTTWRKLTIKGDKGDTGKDGLNLVFKGAWSSKISYKFAHAVAYNGAIFVSIQEDNLGNTPNELIDTEYWIKWKQVAIVTTKLKGIRKVVNNAKRVKFLGCGDIKAFNPDTDTLEVFKDTTALIEHLQYKIDEDNQTIVNLQGDWEGSSNKPVIFEFRVTRNQINDLVFGDGQSIQDGTITKNKLSKDIQESLNSIKENTEKINSIKEDTKATLEENNKKIDKKIEQVNSQYEKSVKKTDKKTQDFIDTKNNPNGIAGLDEHGKIKKEQLPKIDSNVLSIDNNKFKPILSFKPEKQFILMNSSKITSKGRTFEIDEKYLYMFDGQIRKYDKNTFDLVAQTYNNIYIYADTSCVDDKFLYSSNLNTSTSCIDKFDKNTLQTVATSPTGKDYNLRSILVSDDEFLYAINANNTLCKYKKDNLILVAKLDNIYSSIEKHTITSDQYYIYCLKTLNTIIKVNKSTLKIEKEILIDSNANIFSIDCYKDMLYILSKNKGYAYIYNIKNDHLETSHNIYYRGNNFYRIYIKTDNNYVYTINCDSGTKGQQVNIFDYDDSSNNIPDVHYYYKEDIYFIVKSDKQHCYIYSTDGWILRYYKNKLYKILGYEKIEEE
ncbi:WD40 repeat domain-containing protein [Clostridium botulinum]|nr:WD40 repeat domain-containing protein [Clostridium botulinum]